jgi:hypothetical protein
MSNIADADIRTDGVATININTKPAGDMGFSIYKRNPTWIVTAATHTECVAVSEGLGDRTPCRRLEPQ